MKNLTCSVYKIALELAPRSRTVCCVGLSWIWHRFAFLQRSFANAIVLSPSFVQSFFLFFFGVCTICMQLVVEAAAKFHFRYDLLDSTPIFVSSRCIRNNGNSNAAEWNRKLAIWKKNEQKLNYFLISCKPNFAFEMNFSTFNCFRWTLRSNICFPCCPFWVRCDGDQPRTKWIYIHIETNKRYPERHNNNGRNKKKNEYENEKKGRKIIKFYAHKTEIAMIHLS